MKTYTKNLSGQLEEIETKEEKHSYTLEFLNGQKKQLETSLVEVNNLIAEAEKAGVTLKSVK